MGRQIKFSDEDRSTITRKILERTAQGESQLNAAKAEGISPRTWTTWKGQLKENKPKRAYKKRGPKPKVQTLTVPDHPFTSAQAQQPRAILIAGTTHQLAEILRIIS